MIFPSQNVGRSSPITIVALNVGPVEVRLYEGREVRTAAHKRPVAERWLGLSGFDGDQQADRRFHGGPDKAVCVYSADHYPHWEREWGRRLEAGAFGENLTLAGIREAGVAIGDTLRVGGALLQVTQPRQPCANLAARHGRPGLVAEVRQSGFTGFYLRVLEEGMVRAGAEIAFASRDPAGVSIEFANHVMFRRLPDRESLERVLAVAALSGAWRETLSKRLSSAAE